MLLVFKGWTVATDNVVDYSYVVRGLKPGTEYRFIVRARNSHGLSLPSEVTPLVRTLGQNTLEYFLNAKNR